MVRMRERTTSTRGRCAAPPRECSVDDAERNAQESQTAMNTLVELRSQGESRRFRDELGYLLEGLDPDEPLGVRRARCARRLWPLIRDLIFYPAPSRSPASSVTRPMSAPSSPSASSNGFMMPSAARATAIA